MCVCVCMCVACVCTFASKSRLITPWPLMGGWPHWSKAHRSTAKNGPANTSGLQAREEWISFAITSPHPSPMIKPLYCTWTHAPLLELGQVERAQSSPKERCDSLSLAWPGLWWGAAPVALVRAQWWSRTGWERGFKQGLLLVYQRICFSAYKEKLCKSAKGKCFFLFSVNLPRVGLLGLCVQYICED